MKHTPLGYNIIDGRAVIDPEKAEQIQMLFAGYLSGLSIPAAAEAAGITGVSISKLKNILHNRKYLGDEHYPRIMDEETLNAAEEERKRRSTALGRDNRPGKEAVAYHARTKFSLDIIAQKYKDPLRQAEYAYTQIREVE